MTTTSDNRTATTQKHSAAAIRKTFLDYFAERDHKVLPSSPVIPFDDPTLLFINAGMNQFKKVFTGEERAPHPRAATVQKCIRAGGKHNDLENVGFTTRHHTFFEMLGNFSFGDYFKEQAIVYAWELLTKVYGLDPARLTATVYNDDDEAFTLWEKVAPELKNGRILRFGEKDNFWAMGDVGPCGPCSEIHYDRGERFGPIDDHNCVNGDGERFMEVWNLVFMQYNRSANGALADLPKGSVDTGMGLERIAVALQNVKSSFDIDLFVKIIGAIEEVTGTKYSRDVSGASHRVVADHLRALCFSIADGGGISNEKQGYVLRRILRRAARHGRLLGSHDPFIYKLVPALVNEMGAVYPELKNKEEHITKVIRAEEESFGRTLDTGLALFEVEAEKVTSTRAKVIPGDVVFKLYDTHGFPVDLTEVMAKERGLTLDMDGFEVEMSKQRERARRASTMKSDAFVQSVELAEEYPPTVFERGAFSVTSELLHAQERESGDTVLLLDRTPFYVEAGGQIADIGVIRGAGVELEISGVYAQKGYVFHTGKFLKGGMKELKAAKEVTAEVDIPRRREIMRNHTATHLLHAALRKTLGEHVRQAGSLVSDEKLRFDFTHFEQPDESQLTKIESLVNEHILATEKVRTDVLPIEEAKKSGAMQLFGEKYGDLVRVVSIGEPSKEFSKEFCGGTHVSNTAEIGPFMITSEGGVSSGVRRIEAISGKAAAGKMLEQKRLVSHTSRLLKIPEEKLEPALQTIITEHGDQAREIKKLKAQQFAGASDSIGKTEQVGGFVLHWHDFSEVEREAITGWVDSFKAKDEPSVALALGKIDGKRSLLLSASPGAIARGLHVGKCAKELFARIGSRGGGKENFAQGSAPEEIPADEIIAIFTLLLEGIKR